MRNRIAALVAAAFTITVLAGCDSHSPGPVASTATVAVDGKNTTMRIVRCTQLEWYRTIDIGSDFAGAKIVIDQRARPPIADSVHIQNLGGFTGMYSRGDGGSTDMRLSGDNVTITGTANGYKTDKPGEAAVATFKIITAC